MSLRDLLESDIPRVLERDLAGTLSYRPLNADVVRVTFLEWGREQVVEDSDRHQMITEVVSFQVRKSQMPDPKLGDSIQFDGDDPAVWWDFVSRVECEGAFDVKFRRKRIRRTGGRSQA